MSDSTTDRLYNLLPAIYRARDEGVGGEALRALLGVIEAQFNAVRDDITTLYDNWFIETCQDWVVPYIGDLLGVRELNEISNGAFSRRAYVANTFAYRQRKGTPAVVEQLARDVTGWPGRVVEYFQLLATTQHLEHLRSSNRRLDLRFGDRLELIGSPFEEAAYTADIRRISRGAGRYNIPNVGIHLWRIGSYPIVEANAVADAGGTGLYRFSQLGHDIPLFNRPETETSINAIAQEVNVPGPLRRRPLYDELEARRAAIVAGSTPSTIYFDEQPVFELFIDGAVDPKPAEEIVICNLSDWRRPDDGSDLVAVDPVLGRIAFPSDVEPAEVRVSYSYGFSADIGGGSYNRRDTIETGDVTIWKRTVSKSGPVTTIQAAINEWASRPFPRKGIIEVADSSIYTEMLSITFPVAVDPEDGEWLIIQARDGERPTLNLLPIPFTITANHSRSSVTLNGFLMHGRWIRVVGDLGGLTIKHCTLTPGGTRTPENDPGSLTNPSLQVESTNVSLQLEIYSSIVGLLRLPTEMRELKVEESIIDGLGGYAIAASHSPLEPGPSTSLVRTTVFGQTVVKELTLASEVIFTDLVKVDRRQVGCVRFSYVPPGSRTPRRYRCEPETSMAKKENAATLVRPVFTSIIYGTPAYAQLSLVTPPEIRAGTEDGSEMGAFNKLKYPQREANLRIGLDEYMRLGVDTGIFYVT